LKFLQTYFPVIILYAALGIILLTVFGFNFYQKHKKKRSPFTGNLLRSPGESLNEKLMDISDELIINLTSAFIMPFMMYSLFLSDLHFQNHFNLLTSSIYLIIGFFCMVFFLYKTVKYLKLRTVTRLGFEGEIAVGQELNQMMLQGYYVYHDFLADKFNIDHIVIGPAGVFAVETKARAKPKSDNRTADAKVIYDGKSIQFPRWKETKPLEQAKNQAAWLEKWLSSATGEKISVRPVVALPGWYVTRTAKEGIPVINPKQFSGLMRYYNRQGLNDAQIKRVVHQIDQRCRNIEPKAIK